ncbi:CBS domain containing membrane protein [Methanohalobium evestigatum Z-7303]|uniref:CBS domain containing membrane protein n=1 Tax=Methanohalobium evestigatum (strain ATCC BAA-1072 / DSM 3721 / NBRC 107634 / OCM 161 / Z-7303) TaxID=644295 RepID=D7E5T3_METEZ|nr:CBS domain-containing protein [Methanohalobium evestigatum]ADI72955.1 CBS domain containing membrane protein [Methanohalobium evestigatum Z-7303]
MTVVEDIMTKDPVKVTENDYITHARQLMRDYFLRSVPVVDNHDSNHVTGLLTDQDILNITSTKSNLTVKGFERAFPTILPDTDILKASKLLLDAKLHRSPVMISTTEKRLAGIISNRDLLEKINPSRRSPETIGEIMNTKVITCYTDDNVARIWNNMLDWDYTGIPVVNQKNEPIGVVTRRDIIKSGHARINSPEKSSRVEKIMSTPTYTITPNTPITEAIDKIIHYDVGRLTVVNNNKVVGIVDRNDLLEACLR